MPTPMPMNAVSRFIPAASSEPKVSTRTSTATPTPMNSVAPIVRSGRAERVAADGDLQSGVLRGRRRLLERVEAAVLQLLPVHVVLDRGQRGPPVGAERLAGERADHGVHLGRFTRGGHDLLDRRRVGGVGDGGAVRGDEDDLGARAGRRRGELGQLVERVLRLRPRDRELVLEGAADGDEQGHDRAEDRQPRDRHQPAVPEGGATEPREEGAHGKGTPEISGWWRSAAGGAARRARGRRRRDRRRRRGLRPRRAPRG